MPQTADNLAKEYDIKREEADTFALASQQKYAIAKGEGFFTGEIAPVEMPATRKGPVPPVADDEHPRPTDRSGDAGQNENAVRRRRHHRRQCIGRQRRRGRDHAGQPRRPAKKPGVKPIARVIASASMGVPPRIMGIGPVAASKKALERAGLTIKDMDIIEINEAFATQVLSCLKGLGVAFDDKRVNPNGGAIALGHPLGASGARLALTAARQLQRSGGRYALVSLCIGGGQGMAAILERV